MMMIEGEFEALKEPLLGISAISSHLAELGHSQRSIDSMNKCGKSSGSHLVKAHPISGVSLVPLTHKCNLRTCSSCSLKRKRRIRRQLLPCLAALKPSGPYAYRFLTISPVHFSTYDEGYLKIRAAWSKFLRRKYVSGKVLGGFLIIEAKQKGHFRWNVHAHALIYSKRLYNKSHKGCDSILVREWVASSGERANIQITNMSSNSFALNYVLKYVGANKDDFVDEWGKAQYIRSIYKKRLITGFGEFYNLKRFIVKYGVNVRKGFFCEVTGLQIFYFYDVDVERMLLDGMKSSVPPPTYANYVLGQFIKSEFLF